MIGLVMGVGVVCAQDGQVEAEVSRAELWGAQNGVVVVTGVSAQGVVGEGGVVGWDEVRRVTGPLAGEAEGYLGVARAVWRARTRLERGDAVSAEPLFEALFAEYRGTEGPTAAVVAEGLLRCRLRRGALTGAVPAWLAWLRAGRVGSAREGLAPVGDGGTGLVAALPPLWTDSTAVASFAAGEGAVISVEGEVGRADLLDAMYRVAARRTAGMGVDAGVEERVFEEVEGRLQDDAGLTLVWAVVAAQGEPGARRAEAVATLRGLAEEASGDPDRAWVEAWSRVGLGRAMVADADDAVRRLGVVELLRVPALLGEDAPYLAGLALADAARAVRDLGNAKGADALENELMTRFPGHPALDRAAGLRRGATALVGDGSS